MAVLQGVARRLSLELLSSSRANKGQLVLIWLGSMGLSSASLFPGRFRLGLLHSGESTPCLKMTPDLETSSVTASEPPRCAWSGHAHRCRFVASTLLPWRWHRQLHVVDFNDMFRFVRRPLFGLLVFMVNVSPSSICFTQFSRSAGSGHCHLLDGARRCSSVSRSRGCGFDSMVICPRVVGSSFVCEMTLV